MAEYIEREALKNDIATSTEPFNTGSVFRAINRQPAADVVPVVHAYWGSNGIPGSILRGFSACGNPTGADSFRFCPNCGAKMDGGEEGEV